MYPTTDEILAACSRMAGDRVLIITVSESNLTTTDAKTRSQYAFPTDDLIDIDEDTFVFVWADTDETRAKKFYGKLTGEMFEVADLKTQDYREYPKIKDAYEYVYLVDAAAASDIYEAYKLQPSALLAQLQAYPHYTLPNQGEESVVAELVGLLGTIEGVKRWFSITTQEFWSLFHDRIVLGKGKGVISPFAKRIGVTSAKEKNFPTGYSTRLTIYLEPFIKAANNNPEHAQYFLGLFASWAYYAQQQGKAFSFVEGRKDKKKIHAVNLGDAARRAWAELSKILDRYRNH